MTILNTVIGSPALSAWQPVPGITWVQTRSPQFARKLSQRQDSRLVVRGVSGGYLRTFEFHHPLTWAQRLIARYTAIKEATNARITSPPWPALVSLVAGGIRGADDSQGRVKVLEPGKP